ncbi:MAG: 23S rRNA (uracil(1939)-C(5))-methyltransferase RlmD [Firmicutes bacterium]|nr:23S rRNA (uracil(1939)-C(5))-methyltransferase RlmD [Bacillota bacterium]
MIPVSKNEKYEIEIDGMSSDGNGVGHIRGFAVFVPNTCRGDVVNVRITKVKSGFACGAVTEIVRPSEDRIAPMCDSAHKCGGCAFAHMDYDAQLDEKRGIVESAMTRIGGFKDFKLEEIIGMSNPYRYRNKVVFQLGVNEKNQPIYGFFAPKSHKIIPVSDCLLCGEIYGRIADAVIDYAKECGVSVYDGARRAGVLKRIFIRGSKNGEIMVVLSANARSLKRADELVRKLKAVSGKVVSVMLNINLDAKNYGLGAENIVLYGKEKITDTLSDLKFLISPQSFYQVNPTQTEKLYETALRFAGINGGDTVMDIYCGIGTISLCAAKRAGKVIGIEIVERAIADARENARINEIENAEFYAGAAAEIVPKLIADGARPSVVILDPPRSGSDKKTLLAVISATPDRIVYVSCNPSTLARDAKFLAENGYKISAAQAVDMFPHTCHVETVCLLSKLHAKEHIEVELNMNA